MIKLSEYAKRMQQFRLHMELLHQALNHFSCDKAALEAFVAHQAKKYSQGLDVYLKTEENRPRHPVDDMFVRAYGKNLRRQVQAHVEFAENKLHQSELLLRCSFFEAEMKDIHRHCLYAKPTLLGEREIPLGRLISKGEDAVLEEEVEEEVETLDRQSVKKRAKYFSDKLGLKWGDPKLFQQFYRLKSSDNHADVVKVVAQLSDLRNKIVHRDTDYVVKRDELDAARRYFKFVPTFCCQQAVKLYPKQFSEKKRDA